MLIDIRFTTEFSSSVYETGLDLYAKENTDFLMSHKKLFCEKKKSYIS